MRCVEELDQVEDRVVEKVGQWEQGCLWPEIRLGLGAHLVGRLEIQRQIMVEEKWDHLVLLLLGTHLGPYRI